MAALAADGRVMRKSGKAFHVSDLAREYGFTILTAGGCPHLSFVSPS